MKEEYNHQVQQFTEEAALDAEAGASMVEAIKRTQEEQVTECAQLRKQKEHKQKLEEDIKHSDQMPGGTKCRVCLSTCFINIKSLMFLFI